MFALVLYQQIQNYPGTSNLYVVVYFCSMFRMQMKIQLENCHSVFDVVGIGIEGAIKAYMLVSGGYPANMTWKEISV